VILRYLSALPITMIAGGQGLTAPACSHIVSQVVFDRILASGIYAGVWEGKGGGS
jgi:hypothetical protein